MWYRGVVFLFWLGWKIKYRLNSPYIKFRLETAFGEDKMKWSFKRIRQMIQYGDWAYRMYRLGK